MDFTKSQVLEEFARQDRSYRLAILTTHWLRDTAPFKPSATHEARGLHMKAGADWISFADLAEVLEKQETRDAAVSDFTLNQLHALLRAPFEVLNAYCESYDSRQTGSHLVSVLKCADWYEFARLIRNAVSHNFRFDFRKYDKSLMPLSWGGVTLTAELDGTPLTYESFWHKTGYELFLAMRAFSEAMPEISHDARSDR
ncbi:MAG TPA: hypothetical protein VFB45_17580 [Pseudolabrys sp.]|nr:hypothetical protein [Pseudolabrys sp.]